MVSTPPAQVALRPKGRPLAPETPGLAIPIAPVVVKFIVVKVPPLEQALNGSKGGSTVFFWIVMVLETVGAGALQPFGSR